jgi:peptidoglycan/LPS O-acetylase OafA/YrhL
MKHLPFLDGLRGIAIALVVLFHAFSRWPAFVGSQYADGWLAQGCMGVQLFFLISGYVIFMSLERSAGLADFAKRRWLRLFPAMLLATAVVYVTAPLFDRPGGQPILRDVLPGLLFIEPSWLEAIFGGSAAGSIRSRSKDRSAAIGVFAGSASAASASTARAATSP